MSHTLTTPQSRPVRPVPARLAWLSWAALFCVATAQSPGEARGQEILRWKFRPGEVLKYTTEHATVITVKVMGRQRKQKRAVSTTYTWSVTEVSETGEAAITQRIERLGMKVEAPPFLPLDYDSSSSTNSIPEPYEPMIPQLKAAVGAELSFKMKPSGEIADVKIPAATLKKLREGLPDEPSERDSFSEQALKEMVTQTSPPPFPLTAVEPGKTWSSKPSRVPLPTGTLILERSFTYQGPDPKDPKSVLIAMSSRVAVEPAPAVTAKIRAQDGKGNLTFDRDAGRLTSSRGTQKTEMVVIDGGQERDEITETVAVMTLVP